MCGIAGIWTPGGSAPLDELRATMGAFRHRGPEGAAYARLDGGSLLLGFLKLAFTDLPGGMQPLFNADHTRAIVYNGEIYDHLALRDGLIARGHAFRTRSDTEVVLHLYEEHGERFTDHLNGEFAFAIWDGPKRELLLVRDRFGVKPLWYTRRAGQFRFASEAKGLLEPDGADRELDPHWFTGAGLGLADTRRSPFLGIEALRPGQLARVTPDGMRIETWWTPRFGAESGVARSLTLSDATDRLRTTLRRAVERRVGGDVPIALSLSSGLDSSIVAGLAAEVRPGLTAFSLSYPGRTFDEGASASVVARHHGLRFEAVPQTLDQLAEGLVPSLWSTEIATNSLSTVGRIAMTKAVRRAGFKALTGGEAADELFGGYPYFGIESIWRALDSVDGARRFAAQAARERFELDERHSRGTFWDRTDPPRTQILGTPTVYGGRASAMGKLARGVYSKALLQRIGGHTPLDTLREEFDVDRLRKLDPFDVTRIVSRSVFSTFVPSALGDRVEMAGSLEGRVPFLDKDVIALAYTLPERFCIDPDTFARKWVLRRAFADRLPEGFRAQPKHTAMAPTFAEIAGTKVGRELIAEHLSDRAIQRVGVFRRSVVRGLVGAWRLWPRQGSRFARIDGLVGYVLSTQILHSVFIERSYRADLHGFDFDEDRTPNA